ncbi:hypothetical protein DICPUDRAFT_99698 [Dictyostelium purpureum]|uniref:Actin binding protein n=1 Tax=Dictyostelium purpureum TaxID=5786 RepID=F1A1N2_DICPU|nr:uncharacterized protein DICPUDRAFT_99698 [Dictyostelium purpureum]EGC29900.1 hypothetical protein DICPUDRAFT_99698 [Dictyostelium purpureum]|eukprot:XP_003293578.1 hypothetical protein DICPUDRAFT_99698 [Dictyostelium purpureum]
MSDSITLKVRLVDKKVFKKFQFYPKKTVKEARLFIAAELEVDPEQYGLFLPPKDDQNGVWFRDDYPLDFYGLEGENEKENLLFTSKDSPMMEFVEFKKRYRPIKVAKGDNQFKTLMVDDTMNVSDIIKHVSTQVPISSAVDEDQLINMNVYEVEVLSGDMTIREQGYVGECTTNLLRTSKGELNLCVQVPYFEGFMMRKRGGGLMKGLKNWNKRWYSLRKNKLIYYKSKSDNSEMGCILMKTVQAVRPAREVVDIPSKYLKMCFEIVTPARTFIMLASNVNEMKKWVEILDFSRRMFAYETHFFGVASKKVSDGPGGLTIGNNRLSMRVRGEDDDDDSDFDEEEEEQKRRIEEQRQEKEKRDRMEREEQERVRLQKEEQERQAIEQELARAEQERQERIRIEQEQQEREEQERKRIEEEEIVRLMIEEEERRKKIEEKRQEELRKIQEEQDLLKKQQEEFIAKQQQLELEKQRQLQDQLEEDRKLEELMLQMEMDQEERIQKIKEEQERQEQEKIELAKKIKEEEERIKEEQERIRVEQERVEKERKEEEKRIELERQEEERVERERQERIRVEREERERKEEEERKEKERVRKEEEERIKKEQEEIRLKFELELKEKERVRQEEERIKKEQEEERIKQEEEAKVKQQEEEERIKKEQEEEEERKRQQEEEDNIDMMDEFEREEEEREKEQLASKRLRSLQARLEAVSAETPQLKLLLSEAIALSPENLLLSWANYIVSGISSPSLQSSSRQQNQQFESLSSSSNGISPSNAVLLASSNGTIGVEAGASNPSSRVLQPSTATIGGANATGLSGLELSRAALLQGNQLIGASTVELVQLKNLKSMEANLDMYAALLFKLEPQEFDYQHYQTLSSTAQKAEYIQSALHSLGITNITTEQLLSNDSETHLNILLTMYEEVGSGQWEEEFHTQVVSKRTFATKYISQILANSGLGLADSPYELLPTLLSGRVLCELVNKVYPGTIDEKVIQPAATGFCKKNLMLAYNAAKALGSVEIPDIIFTEKMEHISSTALHNLTWSIVETCLLQSADPSKNRNLFHLLRAETRTSFMALEKEKIMLRWFNHHLRKTSNRSINNFTDDVEDCENYAYLFHAIAPQISRKDEILKESDWEKRAEIVIEMSKALGCMPLMSARDIVETENSQLNKLFVCEIMRVCPCLPTYQFRLDVEQLDDQVQKSKDQGNNDGELLKWVNELGVSGDMGEVKHLLDDFKSGYLFLKVLEKVTPAGTLDPKKFRTNPTSVFKMVELCNYTMEICHKLKFNLAGIAGTDLANGDIRANRAILNQIRRHIGVQTVVDSVISNQSAALKWANSKIHPDILLKVKSIQSFKDQFLQDGLFLLELLSAIESNSVDKKHIQQNATTEEKQQSNCRYFLSCAWSVGIPLKVLWEDVQKVRSKSIKHIIETLQLWDNQKQQQQQQ